MVNEELDPEVGVEWESDKGVDEAEDEEGRGVEEGGVELSWGGDKLSLVVASVVEDAVAEASRSTSGCCGLREDEGTSSKTVLLVTNERNCQRCSGGLVRALAKDAAPAARII